MDKTALLKKVRALAEHGVGGEAENAEKLLARMMKKYGISARSSTRRLASATTSHITAGRKRKSSGKWSIRSRAATPTNSYIPRAGARLELNSARIALQPKR